MTNLERFARIEHFLRPWLSKLPPKTAAQIFSRGRTWFSHKLEQEKSAHITHSHTPLRAWNLTFAFPLWNAAGMFKEGNGYHVMAGQGAGAYVAGTTTATPRNGNVKNGIMWPTVPYASSKSASNWMGLPNPGHTVVATKLSRIERVPNVPIGASVSADPGADDEQAVHGILSGLNAYSLAKVDYIEINESCPNVPHAHSGAIDTALMQRLEIISDKFLKVRHRPLPVVVKFSNDLDPQQLPNLLRALVDLKYDGIILGNTSTRYNFHRRAITQADRVLYDMFTGTFGGGLSGAVLKQSSLGLTTQAQQLLSSMNVSHEFHVVRCGGIQNGTDVVESMKQGVLLHQWYTGYYEMFATSGHSTYQRMSELVAEFLIESKRTVTLS